MSGLNKNRFSFHGNEICGSFADYVVYVKPSIFDDWKKGWYVIFSKGDGYNQESKPIYCTTLEDAFNLVEHYSEQKKFDELLNKLNKDYQ